jgi:hypothetical protein
VKNCALLDWWEMRAEIFGCLVKNTIETEKRPTGNEGQVVVHFISISDDIDASRLYSVDIRE